MAGNACSIIASTTEGRGGRQSEILPKFANSSFTLQKQNAKFRCSACDSVLPNVTYYQVEQNNVCPMCHARGAIVTIGCRELRKTSTVFKAKKQSNSKKISNKEVATLQANSDSVTIPSIQNKKSRGEIKNAILQLIQNDPNISTLQIAKLLSCKPGYVSTIRNNANLPSKFYNTDIINYVIEHPGQFTINDLIKKFSKTRAAIYFSLKNSNNLDKIVTKVSNKFKILQYLLDNPFVSLEHVMDLFGITKSYVCNLKTILKIKYIKIIYDIKTYIADQPDLTISELSELIDEDEKSCWSIQEFVFWLST
jgi:hypothetical protein